jgi:hypothetical protein
MKAKGRGYVSREGARSSEGKTGTALKSNSEQNNHTLVRSFRNSVATLPRGLPAITLATMHRVPSTLRRRIHMYERQGGHQFEHLLW